MNGIDQKTPTADSQFHRYTSNAIPWFVRLIWLGFWVFAIDSTVR
jgi:hypothetical protein